MLVRRKMVRCNNCKIVVKYNPDCFIKYNLCIACAIISKPHEYTVRQKLKQRIKILKCFETIYGFDFSALIEIQYEMLKIKNKKVLQYKDWNRA